MTSGEIIRRERKKRKLSQSELAKKLGVTQPYIQMLENDDRKAGDALKVVISKEFGLSIEYIFFNQFDNK